MATLSEKIQCERDAREMIRQGGMPQPDRVEYGHTCIRLFWKESKVVLVVDIDEPPEGWEFDGVPGDADLDDPDEDGPDDFEEEDVIEALRRLDDDDDDQEEAA